MTAFDADSTYLAVLLVFEPFDPELWPLLVAVAPSVGQLQSAGWLQASAVGLSLPAERREQLQAQFDSASIRAAYQQLIAAELMLSEQQPALATRLFADLRTFAELLIRQTPHELADLVNQIPIDLAPTTADRQLLEYYRGLAAGLRDQYAEACTLLSQLLAQPDLEPMIRGRALNSDATFARYSGNYDRALANYQASFALWEAQADPVRQAYVLLNEGSLRYHLQEYRAAERCLNSSLATLQAQNLLYPQALVLINLGLLARDRGNWAQALRHFEQAEAILQAENATDFLGRIANNLGELALLQGQYQAARQHFEQALTQMSSRVYHIDAYLNYGLAWHVEGMFEQAETAYRQALDLVESVERQEIAALVWFRLGQVAAARNDHQQAEQHYLQAIELIEAMRAPILAESLQISLMGRWQQVYEGAVAAYLAQSKVEAAFVMAEKARARALNDLLARNGQTNQAIGTIPSLSELQQCLPQGSLMLDYMTIGAVGPEASLLAALPASAKALRNLLIQPAATWLFAITTEQAQAFNCQIDPNILLATSPFQCDGRRFLRPAILQRLQQRLLLPAQNLLQQAQQVIIVPHGALHHVPWNALVLGELQLDLPVTAIPSAASYLQLSQRPPSQATEACVALSYAGGVEPALVHTHAEAEAAVQALGGQHYPLPAPNIQQQLGHYRIVHIACHGVFVLDQPLASWLQFGPEQTVSALEILTTWQLAADLVVLSACQSGVSEIVRGDEPFGLVRAFLAVGAHAVLVTLWPVDDVASAVLMKLFYQALQSGAAPAEALRQAVQQIRSMPQTQVTMPLAPSQQTEYPFADPHYWAGYQLIGVGNSISTVKPATSAA